MGSPYSQLQTLRYNLSGREIGIEKYKPFTVANEKIASSISVDGSLLGSVRESGFLKAVVSSGEQSSALSDKANLGTLINGIVSDAGGDSSKYGLVISGSFDSTIPDVSNTSSYISSGDFAAPLYDVSRQSFTIVPAFSGEFRELCSYSLKHSHGTFLPYSHDAAEFDFLFFTGSSFAGRVAQLLSGSDAAEFDLIFFTGSYQG